MFGADLYGLTRCGEKSVDMIHVSQGENLGSVSKMMAEVPKFLRFERSFLVVCVIPLAS